MRWFVSSLLVLVVALVWGFTRVADEATTPDRLYVPSPGGIACVFAGGVLAFILAVGIGKLVAQD